MLYCPKELTEAPAYIFAGASKDLQPVFMPDFTRQPHDPFHRVLKAAAVGRVPMGSGLASVMTGHPGWHTLSQVTAADTLLADGVTNPRTLQAISWLLPTETRRCNYFNNTLRFALPETTIEPTLQKMRRMGFHLYTFDPADAERYGMTFIRQFYRCPSPDEEVTDDGITCFFCGANKGRAPQLAELAATLEACGYQPRFHIADSVADFLSYEAYLTHLRTCHCLIDMVQASQDGITRRPVEALFFGKKLISNHLALLREPFYHPDNIFILGHDDPVRLPQFLRQPLRPTPDAVKQLYHVDTFLLQILSP